MRVVVADTTPLDYLLLIDQIELLPTLFGAVHIPDIVCDELNDVGAPTVVQNWIAAPPAWLVIGSTPAPTREASNLDAGELAAIALASQLHADLLLIDERAATLAARSGPSGWSAASVWLRPHLRWPSQTSRTRRPTPGSRGPNTAERPASDSRRSTRQGRQLPQTGIDD